MYRISGGLIADLCFDVKLKNPCGAKKDYCLNCHSHFMAVRPSIRGVVVAKRFFKDLKDEEKTKSIVRDILDCSNADFYELHKFEKHVGGCMVFRAKKESMHIVYCVDKNMQIIFIRVFKNFKDYEKFLDNKKDLIAAIIHAQLSSGDVSSLKENTEEKVRNEAEEVQDEALAKEEEREKARNRKRGPYRKAHANW